MAWGTDAGYAINPARDFGPRLAEFFTGYGTAFRDQYGDLYFWVPIVAPLIGGLIGAALYKVLIGRFLPDEAEPDDPTRRSTRRAPPADRQPVRLRPAAQPAPSILAHNVVREAARMADFVGAVDQGTTSTRFMIFDHGGNEVARHQLEHEQILPQAGWVEHNPTEIWERTRAVIETAHEQGRPARRRPGRAGHHQPARDHGRVEPAHRPALLQRDRLAGHPHRPDRRGAGRGRARATSSGARPACRPATYFSGGKIQWILENVDGVRADAEAGDAVFGNTDSWLLWNLTGGVDGGVHVTDVDQRQPHDADEPGDAGLGRRAARVLRRPAGDAAGDPAVVATRTATA